MAMANLKYNHVEGLPQTIPIFPLTGALLLPRGQLPLNIFEPRYLEMVDHALAGDRLIGMIQPALSGKPGQNNSLCSIGCVGRIISFNETGDGRYLITLFGVSRFEVDEEIESETLFRQVRARWSAFEKDLRSESSTASVDRDKIMETLRHYLKANDMDTDWDDIENTETEVLVNALCMMSPYGPADKQALLEAETLAKRAETLVALSEFSLAKTSHSGNSLIQ